MARSRCAHVPVPPRPEGFALLRLLAGGICNTDLELQRGYYGFAGTPGHEFVAEVVEADTRALIGQARGGRDQPRLHALRMVPQGPGTPLPQSHRAGNRQAPRRVRRSSSRCRSAICMSLPDDVPTEPRGISGAAGRRLRDPGPGVDSLRASAIAVLGDGKLGLLIAHGAERARLPRAPVRAARRQTRDRRARGRRRPRSPRARCPSPRTIGWWTPRAVPKDCAPPPP